MHNKPCVFVLQTADIVLCLFTSLISLCRELGLEEWERETGNSDFMELPDSGTFWNHRGAPLALLPWKWHRQ